MPRRLSRSRSPAPSRLSISASRCAKCPTPFTGTSACVFPRANAIAAKPDSCTRSTTTPTNRSSYACSAATTEGTVPASQDHISDSTPMGGTLIPGGATFRTWAPGAHAVYVLGDFNGWTQDDHALLVRHAGGRWAGFFAGATDGMKYKFFVIGDSGGGH